MTWLLLALLAPLIWSVANYLDKYLLSPASNSGGGSGGLIILSSFMSLAVAFVIFVCTGSKIFLASHYEMIILILSGVFEALYIYFYFLALEIETASTVIALFQFSPVLGLLFGFLFIHEVPSLSQFAAIAIILVGTLCLVVKKGEFKIDWKIIRLMAISTIFVGLFTTFFKLAGESLPLWTSIFWQYIGVGIIGILFCIFKTDYRNQFLSMTKGKSIFLTGAAEILNVGAVLATNAAIVLAPVALVLSVSSVQPLFVLIEGFILAALFPKTFKDDKPELRIQYILGIIFVAIGGFLIYQ